MKSKVTAPKQKELKVIRSFQWKVHFDISVVLTICSCSGGLGKNEQQYSWSFLLALLIFLKTTGYLLPYNLHYLISVLISVTNKLKSTERSSKEWQDYWEMVVITSSYTGHLSHGETTIQSQILCFVPLVDQKENLGPSFYSDVARRGDNWCILRWVIAFLQITFLIHSTEMPK